MKRIAVYILCLSILFLFSGCNAADANSQIIATTLPVFTFTSALCDGTGISVSQLIDQDVSCLHDYTLKIRQMQAIESAELVVISGAGLEDFLSDIHIKGASIIDASKDISLLCHNDGHDDHDSHHHSEDPHIWLSPENAKVMSQNIYDGLITAYPQYSDKFQANRNSLLSELDKLQAYADTQLRSLSCRELITFHDGFSYMAEAFDLTILRAVQEESGSEISARELVELINIVRANNLPAVFTETNGNVSSASVITAETHAKTFSLNMAMSGESYFDAMYQNINTLKEALE